MLLYTYSVTVSSININKWNENKLRVGVASGAGSYGECNECTKSLRGVESKMRNKWKIKFRIEKLAECPSTRYFNEPDLSEN